MQIKILVTSPTQPAIGTLMYTLVGTETVSELQDMVTADVQAKLEGFDNIFIQLQLNDTVINPEDSVFRACCLNIEEFSAMTDTAQMFVTLDKAEAFVFSKPFDNLIMGTIAANTVFLAMEHYQAAPAYDTAQEIAGWIFNTIFIGEMISKLICLKGIRNYLRPHPNKFDFVIVMSSILQILMDLILGPGGADGLSILKLFRLFRALRVARMLRKFKSVRDILDAAMGSVQPIINIMVFMFLVIIVFACLGMQLYGQKFPHGPRQNFDNFLNAFYTLFQVLTGSAWENVLYDCMLASEYGAPPVVVGWFYITFFFLLSNYIVLNLFIGAILSNMSTDTDIDRLNATQGMKEVKIKSQIRARCAQIFANSKYTDWFKAGGKGNLASMEEVMALEFATLTFQEISNDWEPTSLDYYEVYILALLLCPGTADDRCCSPSSSSPRHSS